MRVRNTGSRRGHEVVQLYASRPGGEVEAAGPWLVGFALVDAARGDEVTARVRVAARAFEHWNTDAGRWTVEPGPSSSPRVLLLRFSHDGQALQREADS